MGVDDTIDRDTATANKIDPASPKNNDILTELAISPSSIPTNQSCDMTEYNENETFGSD